MLEPILVVGWNRITGGSIWILTHAHRGDRRSQRSRPVGQAKLQSHAAQLRQQRARAPQDPGCGINHMCLDIYIYTLYTYIFNTIDTYRHTYIYILYIEPYIHVLHIIYIYIYVYIYIYIYIYIYMYI